MKKFMVIYHASAEAMAQMATSTPEQREEGMKYWLAWQSKLGDALVDMGSPLMGGVQLKSKDESIPSQKEVSGYSILQAETAELAYQFLENHPHYSWHPSAKVEVHEVIEM